jgi:putative transposase
MKLNNAKIVEIIRRRNDGWSTNHIRKLVGVSERRVNQILLYYREHGCTPEVGKCMGRPGRRITKEEIKMVVNAYKKYRFSASLLESIIQRDYSVHIPHYTIHKILLQNRLAIPLNEVVIRKKKIKRYERRHSLSLTHIDWHQRPLDGPWVFGVEDDASRMLLSIIECESPTTELSIQGMEEALQYGQIKQTLSDNGSQFTCNHPGHRDDSLFEQYITKQGIHHIRTRPKHPQSNGKIEKWFDTYERHRDSFPSKNKFHEWYNKTRPHTALNWDVLETPWEAFLRKRRKT